ncbi:MAG: glycosyltransferase family 9 protein [Nanoarchaeota archaeon]
MKMLIIKLGAKGDVIRTLPVLIALKEKYPNSEICWITKQSSRQILETSPYIKKIITLPCEINETFDILYNFDIEEEATKLANQIIAVKKYGFYYKDGYANAFNLPAEYYLNTLFDDELKKTNRKTYQQMMFEVAELTYNKHHHPIYLTEKDKDYAKEFIKKNNINTEKLIGIHIGSSPRWPSKSWSEEKIKEFIKQAKQKNYEILLFGGPNEIEKHKKISEDLKKQGIKVIQNNPYNSDNEFFALVNLCSKMICSDSFALHVSLALKKPTIALFFCTSPNEVEDYGLLTKIISPLLYNFFPEKSDQYSEELVNSISVEEVLKTLLSLE